MIINIISLKPSASKKILLLSGCIILVLPFPFPAKTADSGTFAVIPDVGNIMLYGTGDSYFAVNRAKHLNRDMQNHIRKLSSGLRIVSAADDPAGAAVAEKMESIINEVKQNSINEQDMRNFHRFTESALAHHNNVLQRIRLLLTRAGSGIMGPTEREIIQREIDQLLREIDSNAKFASFNRKQVIPDLTAEGLGLSGLDVTRDLQGAYKMVDDAMDRVIRMRAVQGTKEGLLTMRIEGQTFYYVNLQSAQSRIRDLNMAEEITSMINTGTALKFNYGVILLKD